MSSRLTSVFLVSTSVGAQAFKIPLASWIEEEPQFLMSALAAATAFLLVTYAVSFAMAMDLKAGWSRWGFAVFIQVGFCFDASSMHLCKKVKIWWCYNLRTRYPLLS